MSPKTGPVSLEDSKTHAWGTGDLKGVARDTILQARMAIGGPGPDQ